MISFKKYFVVRHDKLILMKVNLFTGLIFILILFTNEKGYSQEKVKIKFGKVSS